MPKSVFAGQSITNKCPNCGRQFKKSITWMKTHNQFPCPNCGQNFDARDFSRGIKSAEKSVDQFTRTLKRLSSKKIRIKL